MTDEAGEWCVLCARHHQPREHPIECARCRRMTSNFHAICDACVSPRVDPNERAVAWHD